MAVTNFGFTPLTPEESLILWQDAFVSIFGSNVNLDPQSVNGLLIQELANVSIDNQSTLSLLYSSLYNPNQATTIWLDAICALMNISRLPAQSSIVTCQVTGVVNTVIPAGSQIANNTNDLFELLSDITIDITGNGVGIFSSIETGAVPVDQNTCNIIISTLQGWESVNNSNTGILGSNVETDNSLRNRRTLFLGTQGSASLSAIRGALLDSSDIVDADVIENKKSSSKTVSGVLLSPHSIMASVIGGSVDTIGSALNTKLTAGCDMDGNTSGVYTYEQLGKTFDYDFTYQIPVSVPVGINIIVLNQDSFGINIIDEIKDAVFDNWNGTSNIAGIDKVRLGTIVNVSRFVPSLLLTGVYQTQSIYIGNAGSVTTGVQISVPIDQILTLDKTDISVTII